MSGMSALAHFIPPRCQAAPGEGIEANRERLWNRRVDEGVGAIGAARRLQVLAAVANRTGDERLIRDALQEGP
jgi:hypothetical protein